MRHASILRFVVWTLLLTPCAGMCEDKPGFIGTGKNQSEILDKHREFGRTLLIKIRTKENNTARFDSVCDKLIVEFTKGRDSAAKLIPKEGGKDNKEEVSKLYKGVSEAIDQVLQRIDDEDVKSAWIDAHNELFDKVSKESGLDVQRAEFWKQAYDAAISVLTLVRKKDPAILDDTGDGVGGELDFLKSSFADRVYPELLRLGVVKFDKAFPQTCDKLAKAIEDSLSASDQTLNADDLSKRTFQAITKVLDEQTRGDPDAKNAWGNALKELFFQLKNSVTRQRFQKDNQQHWRHLFTILKDSLAQAKQDDKKFLDDLNKNRSDGGASNTTAAGTSSGFHGTPHHARAMGRIQRTHIRRSAIIRNRYGA